MKNMLMVAAFLVMGTPLYSLMDDPLVAAQQQEEMQKTPLVEIPNEQTPSLEASQDEFKAEDLEWFNEFSKNLEASLKELENNSAFLPENSEAQ